ncbi:MAG: hypothetical protein KAU23_11365, partial [Anaerolineales bacterium]|nr:hypothetical protein [Anaerolineales bacterium]
LAIYNGLAITRQKQVPLFPDLKRNSFSVGLIAVLYAIKPKIYTNSINGLQYGMKQIASYAR